MKTIQRITLIIILSCGISSQVNAQEAYEHMTEVTEVFSNVKQDTWKYLKAVTQGKSARKIEKTRQGLLSQYKEEKKNAYKIKKTALREALITYLDMCYTVLKEDFDKILDMEDIAEQSYDLMEAYLMAKEKAGDKLDEAFDEYKLVEESYATANNINLVEDDRYKDNKTKKIEKAGDALAYYNKIFLIYFKPFKQEAYALDALNREDISGVEQNANSLGTLATEAKTKLKEAGSYKGYTGLKTAANEYMTFYELEAEKQFPILVDFYLKKEAFEKAQQKIEAKKQKDRTQQDIDEYNAASEEYNAAVNSFNDTVNEMNNKRNELYAKWQKTIEHFFSNYAK